MLAFQNSGSMFKGFPSRISAGSSAYNRGGLLAWFDAAVNKNTNTNGEKISYWIDRASGIVASQTSAGNQPTYVSSDGLFNNNPSFYFPSIQALQLSTALPLGGTSTVVIVARSVGTISNISLLLGNNTNVGLATGGTSAGITGYGLYYSTATPYVRTTVEDTSSHIVVANAQRIIIDGVDQAATVNGSFSFAATTIGCTNGNTYPSAYIAEILVYQDILTSAECIELCNTINASKYLLY